MSNSNLNSNIEINLGIKVTSDTADKNNGAKAKLLKSVREAIEAGEQLLQMIRRYESGRAI